MKIETSSHAPDQPATNTSKCISTISHIAWSIDVATRYKIIANIAYGPAQYSDLKLDLYQPTDSDAHRPTLIFIHGGGWTGGSSKENFALWFLPFLQLGWTVLNVEYRRSNVSPAPAAVQDCLRALHWIGRNAYHYGIDLTQLVVAGSSAGGHLALTTAMISACLAEAEDGIEESGILPSELLRKTHELPTPAAIINWYGITDVADLLIPPNLRDFAVQWVGTRPDRMDIARLVSPMTYIRAGLPPIITIHGDQDLVVPHNHAVRLHQALSAVGVSNQLITVLGAGHLFEPQDKQEAYPLLLNFLEKVGILIASPHAFDKSI